jgi:hypothetical protein
MQRLEVSGAVRQLYGSLGVKGLTSWNTRACPAPYRDYFKCTSALCCQMIKGPLGLARSHRLRMEHPSPPLPPWYYLNLPLLCCLSEWRLHCRPSCSEPVHCEILVPNEQYLEIDAGPLSTKGVVCIKDGYTVTAHYCVFNISVNGFFFRRVILREPDSWQVRLVCGKWVREEWVVW